MGPDQKYAEFLRDKRVVLVGPSSAYEGSGAGDEIDSYDVVVRLNWAAPVPRPLWRDLGRRTDVLYKRLLHRAYPSPADLKAWIQDGIAWAVTGDEALSVPNARHFARLAADAALPWTITGAVRREIIAETHTSPLIGVMAIAHLLKQPLRSLDVKNVDFYDGGYQQGYGGREYRRGQGRAEGKIGEPHAAPPQLRYLGQLRLMDRRLAFDELLERKVQDVLQGATLGAQVVIPARYASSRFPGKALALIDGRPMILRTLDRVAQVARDPIVATDDERIASVVRGAGFRAELTGDHLTGTDRVAEVVARIAAKGKPDIFLNVQGDEPLVEASALLKLVQAKRALPGSVINAMSRLDGKSSDPTIVKAAIAPDGRLLYASRAAIPATKTGDRAEWRQMGLYAYSAKELAQFAGAGARTPLEDAEDVEILRFLELGVPVRMVEVDAGGPAVDLPEHVEAVEAVLRGRELVPA